MVYQTLKFYLVRVGLSIFLIMTLGFSTLYFFHEIALPHAKVDDLIIQCILGFICVFLGFFAYGLFGDHLFEKALRVLKGISFEQIKEKETIRQFENLLEFTFSSFFLPLRGRSMRKEIVMEYAEYLHSIGRDNPSALRIYLKAFLQNPKDSRFRMPLLSALKSAESLEPAEIDLLLIMSKTEAGLDKVIVSHLAATFLYQQRFNRITEPIFLAAIEQADENTGTIVDFVLPLLLVKNRSDEYALNFYLRALVLHTSHDKFLRGIISKSFCHGHWEAIDPQLHEKCGKIFEELSEEKKKEILLEVRENQISEKWKKLKLFSKGDKKTLRELKLQFGIMKPGFIFIRDGVFSILRGLKLIAKKMLLKTIDVLIWYRKSSLILKFASLFLAVFVVLAGVGAWKVQQEKTSSMRAIIDNSMTGMSITSKDLNSDMVHTIQIGAVTYKRKADKMLKILRNKGVAGLYIIKTKRRAGGYWYKIRLKKFSKKEDAQRFADHMINRGIIKNYFIVTYVPQSL